MTSIGESSPKLPVIVLVDTSATMGQLGAVERAGELLASFKARLESDEVASHMVELALVTCGSRVQVLPDFVPPAQFNTPILTFGGQCLLGSGVLRAFALAAKGKHDYLTTHAEFYSPIVVLIVAGSSADLSPGTLLWRDLERERELLGVRLIGVLIDREGSGSVAVVEQLARPFLRSSDPTCVSRIFDEIMLPFRLAMMREESFIKTDNPKLEQSPVPNLDAAEAHERERRTTEAKRLPRIIGASVTGPLHTLNAIPCQDACMFETLPGGRAAIAVADGLGSADKSDLGSRLAVEAALAEVRNWLCPVIDLASDKPDTDTSVAPGRPLSEAIRAGAMAARRALETQAEQLQCPLRDLACTLIVTAFGPRELAACHIGDGAVVAQIDGALTMVSGPGDSEYVNEVVPLTSSGWEDHLRATSFTGRVSDIAAFTDGCQRAALRRDGEILRPHAKFFLPLFTYVQGLGDLKEGHQDLREFLASKRICDNSDDDKTLVLATLEGAIALEAPPKTTLPNAVPGVPNHE